MRRSVLIYIALAVLAWSLLACASRSPELVPAATPAPGYGASATAPDKSRTAEEASTAAGSGLGVGGDAGLPQAADIDRKIIYTVSLDLIVKDTEASVEEVQRVAGELGGFIAQSSVWSEEGYPRATMTVRVPADKLDEAVTRFRALAVDVERQNIGSQEVTEEYVDLEGRLKNEQRTESELLELLNSRSETGKTEEILEVYRELSSCRSRIEQIQGRMKYLDNLSALATVQISLTPDVLVQPIVVGGWKPQGTARNAVRMLLRTLEFLGDVAIVFVIYILPVLVIIAAVVFVVYWIVRSIARAVRRRRARAKGSVADQASTAK
jgi:hypothetical protein